MERNILIAILVLMGLLQAEAQYISEVLEYRPAPGQFINASPWGVPSSTASIVGGVNGILCLGSFGGRVVFRFEEPVENHPDNPFGVDFTIFGNPLFNWSEPGVVWVMQDHNKNGLPDDTWYELAGSDYYFSSTKRGYQVTYSNPGDVVAQDVPWTDQLGNSGTIKANSAHNQPYYPLHDTFPEIPESEYALTGTLIIGAVDVNDPPVHQSLIRAFGYADNQYRGSAPYTVPDNPYTKEVENSGGDAFDISWAVDTEGNYVELDTIHFVKVQNGILHAGGWLGEVSTEITGAVDVAPDQDISGPMVIIVVGDLPREIHSSEFQMEAFVFHGGRILIGEDLEWSSSEDWASVDEDNLLTVDGTGPLELTASLKSDPRIRATVSTTVKQLPSASGTRRIETSRLNLYPNPAIGQVRITGAGNSTISFYGQAGNILKQVNCSNEEEIIQTADLPAGIYLVRIVQYGHMDWLKFVKH